MIALDKACTVDLPGGSPAGPGVVSRVTSGAILVLLLAGCLVLDLMTPTGPAIWLGYVLTLVVTGRLAPRPRAYGVTAAATLLVVAGFALSPYGIAVELALANRAACVGLLWLTAWLLTRTREAQEQQARTLSELQESLDNVRTLRGLLPICASCKKIRNDQGYWVQLEAYVRDHTHADFSHGICPDCARRLYPELQARSRTAARRPLRSE